MKENADRKVSGFGFQVQSLSNIWVEPTFESCNISGNETVAINRHTVACLTQDNNVVAGNPGQNVLFGI